VLPVVRNLGTKKLKIVRLQESIEFKKDGPKPSAPVPLPCAAGKDLGVLEGWMTLDLYVAP
jgi:hypothetical protein